MNFLESYSSVIPSWIITQQVIGKIEPTIISLYASDGVEGSDNMLIKHENTWLLMQIKA